MARIESWYKQDLKKPVPIRRMETVFNQDALGHLFGVEVYSNGEAVTLAGSVTGYCLLADGTTVPVSGTRSANRASIVIPQTAYSVIGPITITVKLTDGSAITTLLAVVGMVARSRTGQQVSPGSTITDWTNQISAQLQAVQTAADNVGATVATPFDSTVAYVAGNYVTYNGNVYRFTTDHAAGEWNASHVSKTSAAQEISDLKSALNKSNSGIDSLDGEWVIGVLDRKTVYQNLKYMVCNPTIQQYDRDIVFTISNGYYLNLNFFDSQDERTASWTNQTNTFTVPNGTRFNVSVTENPLDDTIVITDKTRFVNAVSFNTVIGDRLKNIDNETEEMNVRFQKFKNGIDELNGEWYIGALDNKTVYPNVKGYVCNPTIQLYDRDITLNIASGYMFTLNLYNESETRTSIVSDIKTFRKIPAGKRFNVYVSKDPVDTTTTITDKTPYVEALTFKIDIESRLENLESNSQILNGLATDASEGYTLITDSWQVGALDGTTVYPNVDKFTLSNPVLRSYDRDVDIVAKSGFKFTLNYYNSAGTKTSTIPNNTRHTVKANQRFNLYVNRNPVDQSEVITDQTMPEFITAIMVKSAISGRIDELKAYTDPTDNPPSYYLDNDYMKNKCDVINSYAKQCSANGDVFIFITDEHWAINQKKSPSLIRYISHYCNIPRVFSGGDCDDYGSEDFCNALRDCFTHKIYHVVGNHDWFPPTDGDMLYYWMDMFNNDQIGNAVEHYYYVDNQQKRIRYIVINAWVNNNGTLESGYSNEQLLWFTNTALNVPAGWDILVFTHFIGDSVTATPEGAQGFRNAIDAYNADPSHAGKVIAIISGHTHFDTVCHTAGGVPIIITTCDKNIPNGDEPWLTTYRPSGTINEQAFDVMCINRESKTIHAIRIGCPAMDNTDLYYNDSGFDFTPTLEVRTIQYS